MRINNIEYRNISFPEIIRWFENTNPSTMHKYPEFCCTIAMFKKNSEGYYLEFIDDRPIDYDINWQDFRTLIQVGYNELNNQKENKEEYFK